MASSTGKVRVPEFVSLPAHSGSRMMTWLLLLYFLICLFFLDNTYHEGEVSGSGWDGARVLGLVLCLAWPLLVVHVIISAYRNRELG